MNGNSLQQAVAGCILGTATGDAIGLPTEGLSRLRTSRMHPNLAGHSFILGRGMTSDDTEHTCMVAQSLIESAGDLQVFARSLSRQLRLWLLGLPAGAGLATVRATVRLLAGCGPHRSGVFSAGNGPAMRSAVIGVCYGHDQTKMRELVRACTRITHTDPKAEHGARAVALAAHLSARRTLSPQQYCQALGELASPCADELTGLLARAAESAEQGHTTESFAQSVGCRKGVSGYIYATVPVALHAVFLHPTDFRAAVTDVIRCGGDTDTTAAIVGGIVGAGVGKSGIPGEWIDGLLEWPRSVQWMEVLSGRLAEVVDRGSRQSAVALFWPGVPIRNAAFLAIVLVHGFRRLLPPY